jgi:hypothetical protein
MHLTGSPSSHISCPDAANAGVAPDATAIPVISSIAAAAAMIFLLIDIAVSLRPESFSESDWWLPTFTQVPQAICHLTVPGHTRAVMILARPGRSVHGLCDQRKQAVRNRVEPDMGTASRLTR